MKKGLVEALELLIKECEHITLDVIFRSDAMYWYKKKHIRLALDKYNGEKWYKVSNIKGYSSGPLDEPLSVIEAICALLVTHEFTSLEDIMKIPLIESCDDVDIKDLLHAYDGIHWFRLKNKELYSLKVKL